jgi:osmotically inducible lipoprotein OsmB
MKPVKYCAIALLSMFTFGCTGMTSQQQRTLSGGAIGAAGGAFITGVAGGNAAVGAALGGAAGALTGYVLGEQDTGRHHHKKKRSSQ